MQRESLQYNKVYNNYPNEQEQEQSRSRLLEPGPAFSRSQGRLWIRDSELVWEKGQTNLNQAQIKVCSGGLCPQGLNQAQAGGGLNS